MVEINIIAAVAKNGVIGKDGDIPWRIKEDFAHFKETTLGHPCIMGKKTYQSLPDFARPLPGRENIVLTRDKSFSEKGITVKHSFNEAIEYAKNNEKVFITGGSNVYKKGLNIANILLITRIHKEYEGDTFFPEVNWDAWDLTNKDEREGFTFETYKRK